MARTLVRFVHDNRTQWGILFGKQIAPLPVEDLQTGHLLCDHWDALWNVDESKATLVLSTVELLAPITVNQQFICQGVNYQSHVKESGMQVKDLPFNTIFTKASTCITSAHAPVVCPPHVRLLDYEVELGLVLRSKISHGIKVDPDNLGEFLAGVTIVNDISARDVQLPQGQFYKGKSYRGFGPVGPGIVLLTPSEWKRWPELHMRLSVNGQLRQDAYCREMIHQPVATLTELSSMHDLNPGDLIATGTPAGCAAKAPSKLVYFILKHFMSEATKWRLFIKKNLSNPAYLRSGDVLSLSIRTDDGAIDLGEQSTRIQSP